MLINVSVIRSSPFHGSAKKRPLMAMVLKLIFTLIQHLTKYYRPLHWCI